MDGARAANAAGRDALGRTMTNPPAWPVSRMAGAHAPDTWRRSQVTALAFGLTVAIAIRLALLPTPGMTGDLDLFAGWVHRLATDVPLGNAFDLELTFGPVMAYLFWLIGLLIPAFQSPVTAADPVAAAAIKLPAVIADLVIVATLAWALRDRPSVAVAAALGVALVPVTWYVSAWWGQFESIYTLFGLLAAVAALRGHWALAGVALALALGTKPQALPFVVPLAAFALARLGPRRALVPIAATAITFAVLWLPFLAAGGPTTYLGTIGGLQGEEFAVLSLRAWNPWWIVQSSAVGAALLTDTTPVLGPLTPRLIGYVAAGLGMAGIFLLVWREATPRNLLLGLAAAVLVAFCLLTTMHERYSFAGVVFLAALLADRRLALAWVILAATVTLNLLAARPPTGLPGSWLPLDGPLGIAGSAAITAILVASLLLLRRLDAPTRPAGGQGA
jgi:Gpi18-like mannosyltransferase